MNSYFRYVRGYLSVYIKGLGATRFINICSKRGIKLWDMERKEDGYLVKISIKEFRSIREIVRKTKVKAVIVSKHGLPFFFVKMSYRKGFVLGALLCLFGLVYMKNFIWGIEFNGNVSLTDDMLMEYLEENEICMGTRISNVDTESLEKQFRKDFPDITWISIGQEGTALTIDIKERDVAIYEEEEYMASSLYAPCEGIVTSIVVRSGLATVKSGDVVEQGQLIVDGILPVVKTDGTISDYNLVNADADVVLCYNQEYYDEISLYSEEKVYSGEVSKEFYLRIGNKTLVFNLFTKDFEQEEVVQTFYQVEIWEHFYLPVWFGVGERREYELTRVKMDEETAETILNENLALFLKTLEEKGVQNLQKDVKISISGSMLILSGTLTLADTNMLREEINASIGTELENGQYNTTINGDER